MSALGRRAFLGSLGAGGVAAALAGVAPSAADAATGSVTSSSPLPSYAASAANVFDPATSVYNWKASNTRRHRAALGQAQAGGDACEVFVGDSLTAGCTNVYTGTFDRLHAWPLVYRDTLARLGVPANGTGIVRIVDQNFADPRISWTGSWLNAKSDACAVSAGATATFTTDKAGTAVAVLYGRYPTSGGFTVSVDGATSGPGFLTVAGGGSGWARAELTGLTDLQPGSTITVRTASKSIVVLGGFEVYTPAGGLAVHNVAQSASGVTLSGRTGWGSVSDLNQNLAIWSGLFGSPYRQPPSTLHLALGGNDVVDGASDDAITAGLTAVRNAFPNADCFLYLEPRPSSISDARWSTFGAALYALADTLDVPLFDMQDRLGGYSLETATAMVGDTFGHLSSGGYADWGRSVALTAAR